jgi:3-dehydroquinate synthase
MNMPISVPSRYTVIHQSVTVQFDYAVHFTEGLFELKNHLFVEVLTPDRLIQHQTKPANLIVIIDGGLNQHQPQLVDQIVRYCDRYSDQLCLKSEPLIISGGEAVKNNAALVTQIQQLISDRGLCRHSYVIAIGGGAVLDLVGYASATAHRGVRLVRVPTTVLAQDDSGVGVKNSINAFGKKNFLGTFTPPYAVINDSNFLKALGQRDWIAGLAEAVKVALIKDRTFFDLIESNISALVDRDMTAMRSVIQQSCQHHLQHIGTYGDPFEMGTSRPLDFGHWSAHRLEYLTHYRLRHGEAVAIGIALDSTYCYFAGMLPQKDWVRILNVLQGLGFVLWVPELSDYTEEPGSSSRSVFQGLTEFREHLGGEFTIMLLAGIGAGIEVHQVNLKTYQRAIDYLESIASEEGV